MAIGGAIGVGLFLGSRDTVRLAGPAVILSYLLGAGIALIMSYVLAEMAVVHPVAGAFGVYAEKYLNPWAGFSVRASYGVAQIIAIGAEVTAAGIYISYWLPHVPQWIWVVLVSAALVALNSMQVNRLGEFEYWFAMIKVTAILAFIDAFLCFGLAVAVLRLRPLSWSQCSFIGGMLALGAESALNALSVRAGSPEEIIHWQRLRLQTRDRSSTGGLPRASGPRGEDALHGFRVEQQLAPDRIELQSERRHLSRAAGPRPSLELRAS